MGLCWIYCAAYLIPAEYRGLARADQGRARIWYQAVSGEKMKTIRLLRSLIAGFSIVRTR
jgi:hypothetical protein